VGQTAPGTRAKLGIIRNGQTKTLSIHHCRAPGRNCREPVRIAAWPGTAGGVGMQLKDLTPAQRKQWREPGCVVGKVLNGPALKAGVHQATYPAGAGPPMRSAAELRDLAPQLPRNKPVPVLVRRGLRPCSCGCVYRNKPVQHP